MGEGTSRRPGSRLIQGSQRLWDWIRAALTQLSIRTFGEADRIRLQMEARKVRQELDEVYRDLGLQVYQQVVGEERIPPEAFRKRVAQLRDRITRLEVQLHQIEEERAGLRTGMSESEPEGTSREQEGERP